MAAVAAAYLAKRLKRRLAEDALRARFRASENLGVGEAPALAGSSYEDDTAFVAWSAGTAARVPSTRPRTRPRSRPSSPRCRAGRGPGAGGRARALASVVV